MNKLEAGENASTCTKWYLLYKFKKNVELNEEKCGVVYELSCKDCDSVYIGETGR